MQDHYKVGELANALGTTVRTLHHYESLGLLSPERSNGSGHRIYGESQVRRLQKIQLLRKLGFPLREIKTLLSGSGMPFLDLIRMHKERISRQFDQLREVRDMLEELESRLSAGKNPTADELFLLLETMDMFEEHYTEEQLEQLKQRREALGEEGMRKGQQAWQEPIAEVKAAAKTPHRPTAIRDRS